MQTTETELVEAYGRATPHEHFTLIYKNYEVFLKLVECYETGLFNRILYEREYNIKANRDFDNSFDEMLLDQSAVQNLLLD